MAVTILGNGITPVVGTREFEPIPCPDVGGGGGSGTVTFGGGDANNYVLTSTGVGNEIQGEPNLQFDGSTLTVTGDVDISGNITVDTIASGVTQNFLSYNTSTGAITYNASGGGSTNFLRADGTWAVPAGTYVHPNHTGQVTSVADGVQTLDITAITDQTAITSGLASTDEFLINDSGVFKRMDVSVLESYMQSNLVFGTVTSVAAGNGMDFTTIVSTGSVTMGTPSTLNTSTTNTVTATSHAHAVEGFAEISGTPVANQVALWNSATDLGGNANLTFNGNKLTIQGTSTQLSLVDTDDSNNWTFNANAGQFNIVFGGFGPFAIDDGNTTNNILRIISDKARVSTTLDADIIGEFTATAGVTVDSVLLKDGGITLATGPAVNEIETTITDDDTHIPTSGAVVDYAVPIGYYSFTNGLTDTAGAVKLGGTLTGNTTIDGVDKQFAIFGEASAGGVLNAVIAGLTSSSSLQTSYVSTLALASTYTQSQIGVTDTNPNVAALICTWDGANATLVVEDSIEEIGFQYNADYSTNGTALGDRWIPDYGAVQAYADTKATISGTPADNYLAVWTSASAIEGESGLGYVSGTSTFYVGYSTLTSFFTSINNASITLKSVASSSFTQYTYSNTAALGNLYTAYRYGGASFASPTAAPTDAHVAKQNYYVYDGTNPVYAGTFMFQVDGAVALNNFDTKFLWYLKNGASAAAIAMQLGTAGLQLSDYGSGSITGTKTYYLAVDASGNVIEETGDIISLGTNDQIPVTNVGGTDFDYSADFTYNSALKNLTIGGSSTTSYGILAPSYNTMYLSGGTGPSFNLFNYSNTASYTSSFAYSRYGGTKTATAAAPTNAIVGNILYYVYDGTATRESGTFVFQVDGAIATNDFDTKYIWSLKNGAAANAEVMVLSTSGLKLSDYGSGSITGTPTYYLAVDASGNIIEESDFGYWSKSGTNISVATSGDDILLNDDTERILFSDGDSSIYEGVDDNIFVTTLGTAAFLFSTSANFSYLDFCPSTAGTYDLGSATYYWENIHAAGYIFLDGGDDTYIIESTANTMAFVAGATTFMVGTSTGVATLAISPITTDTHDVGSTTYFYKYVYAQRYYIDDGSTYIYNNAGEITFVDTNGTTALSDMINP